MDWKNFWNFSLAHYVTYFIICIRIILLIFHISKLSAQKWLTGAHWCFKASAVLMFYPHYINLLQDSWKHAAIPWRFLHIFLLRQYMQILLSFQGLHRKAPKTWICTSLKLIVKACQTWIRICFWRVSVISLLNIIRK